MKADERSAQCKRAFVRFVVSKQELGNIEETEREKIMQANKHALKYTKKSLVIGDFS